MDPPDDDIQFDFFDDEPATKEGQSTQRVRLPRRGGGGGGGGGRGGSGSRRVLGSGGDGPPTRVLRLAGAVLALIVIVLFFALVVSRCTGSSKHDTYAKYMDQVRVIAQNSQEDGASVVTALTTSGLKATDIEAKLDGIAVSERKNVAAARGLDAPGPLRDEQQHLVEALQLRVSGIQGLANAFRSTSGSKSNTGDAPLLAQQGDRLLASDIVWDDLWQGPAQRELKRQGVSDVNPPESHVVTNRDLLGERSMSSLLTRLRGIGKGGTPTGVHGTNIVSLKANGGQELSQGSPNTVVATTALTFELTIKDSGDSQEVGIAVTLTIGTGADAIKKTQTIQSINPQEEQSVTFTNLGLVPFATKTTVKIDVAAVPAEKDSSNNTGTYPVIFSLPG